jgi:hypothetical protein
MFSPLQSSSIEDNGSQQAPPEQERERDPAVEQPASRTRIGQIEAATSLCRFFDVAQPALAT